MSAKFDPYEVLGVERDASDKEIKAAGKRAAKKTHPDAGGTEEEFQASRRALMILSDPEKRAKFDCTGDADEIKPDTREAMAMGMIAAALSALTNKYLLNAFAPALDPRKMPIVDQIASMFADEIQHCRQVVGDGKKHAAFLKDLAKRFSKKGGGFDFIARQFEDELANVEEKIREMEDSIESRKVAIELIKRYDFRSDPPSPAPTYSFGATAPFTGTRLY